MLKRISKIQNVGKFRGCKAGNIEFNKISIIYGLNTYGKSTLTDIFKSLRNGDDVLIKKRLSIPEDKLPQEVVLSFQKDGKEVAVSYNQRGWSANIEDGQRINIYDEDFYHQNLFSSREFTRSTKEQFSAFILGKQGVDKANLIAGKNKVKGDLVRTRTRLTKDAFADIADVKNFLALPVDKTKEELESERDRLREEWANKSRQQKALQEILGRAVFKPVEQGSKFETSAKDINEVLRSTFQTENVEAQAELEKHIERCFKTKDKAEAWIRQGVEQNNGVECQFCGQELSDKALSLLEQYKKSFDTSFQDFRDQAIKRLLDQDQMTVKAMPQQREIDTIAENSKLELIYKDISDIDLGDCYERLEALAADIRELKELVEGEFRPFKESLDSAIKEKSEAPQQAVREIEYDTLLSLLNNYNSAKVEYNALGAEINECYAAFKEKLRLTDYATELGELKSLGEMQNLKIKRFERDGQCKELSALEAEVESLEKEIPRLLEELQKEQSDYLDKFFAALNENFQKFGSRDFGLSKAINRAGHVPIYHLKVSFRGKVISETNIDRIFSESDRRALALAVFWTSLSNQSDEELARSVVVLDDPVTSFDMNRRHTVNREIINISERACQVILLTHYEPAVVDILNKYKKSKPIMFCQIVRDGDNSTIEVGDAEAFCRNDHENKRVEILSFISGQSRLADASCLRVFLEYEIDSRFAKQIIANGISNMQLGEKIDKLHELQVISDATKNKSHAWREDLNPDHHRWSDSNDEERRQLANDFFEFIYNELSVA
ncbi:AAA family ATPase [Pseudomonas indica]|uniref:Wobble nucleotide-excising tRNase n=1 Tax=Pseudomonas indica TaxID=137658 RepID=A0A1G9B236_9PSED|nr:AAA family ATPase [Pseudomonas indica]SDK33661.1 Wobble nucleotide-excising tRNase [Pseudomonas indica]